MTLFSFRQLRDSLMVPGSRVGERGMKTLGLQDEQSSMLLLKSNFRREFQGAFEASFESVNQIMGTYLLLDEHQERFD